MPRILIVGEDAAGVASLQRAVAGASYEVKGVPTSQDALRAAFQFRPHLIILDIGGPASDGSETCRRLREFYDGPIILLSALTSESDKVKGLDAGADDYVAKPFGEQELLARLRAQLRTPNRVPATGRLPYMDESLVIDLQRKQVAKRGRYVSLTPTEFELLACLVRHSGEIMAQKKLLTEALGPEYQDELNYLKVYITRLREKLEDDPKQPQYILTHRGMGYSFNPRRYGG